MEGSFQKLLYEILISLQILAATLFKQKIPEKVDYSDFTEITLIVTP